MSIASVNVKVGADIKEFQRNMAAVSKQFADVGQRLRNTSNMIRNSVSLPFGAAAVAGAKFSADLQSELIKVNTLVGISGNAFKEMRQAVSDVSSETGKAKVEVAQAAFAIYSAGLRGQEALDLLRQSAKASAVGLGDQKDIARAATGVMQAYGSENMSAAKSVDTLMAIVRAGNLEASELAPSIGKVIPIAQALGVSFEEVGANIAVFTRLGISASEAVTSLKAVLSGILKPTKEAQEELASYGLTFADLRNKIRTDGLASVLQQLIGLTNGNVESLGRMIPSVEALADVLGTAGAQGEAYQQVLGEIRMATGMVNDGFKTAAQGDLLTYQKTMNDLKTTVMELGDALMPVFRKVGEAVREATGWFKQLSAEQKETAIQIGALVAASPLLLSTLASIADVGASFARTMSKSILPSISNMAKALSLGNPLMLGLVATGVAIGAVVIYWDEFKQGVERATTALSNYVKENDVARAGVKLLAGTHIALVEYLKLTWKQFSMTAEVIHEFNKSLFKGSFDGFGEKMSKIADQATADWLEMFKNIKAGVVDMNKQIDKNGTPIITGDSMQNAVDSIKNKLMEPWALLKELFFGGGGGGFEAIESAITNMEPAVIRTANAYAMLNDSVSKFNDVGQLAVGTWKPALVEITDRMQVMREMWKDTAEDMARTTEMAMSNMVGDAISGFIEAAVGMGDVRDVFRDINNQLANLLENLGKTAIFKGLIEGTLKSLFANPGASLAIGTAALAFAGILRGATNGNAPTMQGFPAFANGALVTGPMLAMVGDNPNARRDPEAILPVSKLRGMLADVGGGSQQLYGRLNGTDIYISNDRTAYRLRRTSGR